MRERPGASPAEGPRRPDVVFHPILFAAAPVLSIGLSNIDEVSPSEIAGQVALVVLAAAACWSLLWLWTRELERSGLAVTLTLLWVFAWGDVAAIGADSVEVGRLRAADAGWLWIAWGGLWLLGVSVALRWARASRGMTRFANLAGVALVTIQVVLIGAYEIGVRRMPDGMQEAMAPGPSTVRADAPPLERPDLYFLVPDRYGGRANLASHYGFDNSPFLEALRARGFWIGTDSRANYFFTPQSLASSLNMTHLQFLSELGVRGADLQPLYQMIRDSRLVRYLRARGYRYVHSGSWWVGTRRNPMADMNLSSCLGWSLLDPLLAASVLSPLMPILSNRRIFCHLPASMFQSVPQQFDNLTDVPELAEPTFTFAHFLVPHEPWVFDRNGDFVTEEERAARTTARNYTEQLIHTNTLLLQLVDTLLARSESPPVIVLQADEGPFTEEFIREGPVLENPTEHLRNKYGILTAIYAPGTDTSDLHPSITPVNTWRWILNQYFGEDLEMLPDRSYAFEHSDRIFDFVDITSRIEPPAPEG